MSDVLRGACLCGACGFAAEPGSLAGACHCGMCRKWTGGIFLSVDCGSSVRFDEGAPVASYRGSAWGERIFCARCGSSILWQTRDGSHQHVSIQAFGDPGRFELGVQVFIDRKPANYALSNQTDMMTEAEIYAIYAPETEARS